MLLQLEFQIRSNLGASNPIGMVHRGDLSMQELWKSDECRWNASARHAARRNVAKIHRVPFFDEKVPMGAFSSKNGTRCIFATFPSSFQTPNLEAFFCIGQCCVQCSVFTSDQTRLACRLARRRRRAAAAPKAAAHPLHARRKIRYGAAAHVTGVAVAACAAIVLLRRIVLSPASKCCVVRHGRRKRVSTARP